jgi:class 3 adenylate cyclase
MFHGHERKYAGVRSCNHANLHRVELCRNARPDTEVPEASAKALLSAEALLGQIEGDLVMGIFVRGLAGHGYRRKAVERAIRLICSVDWLAIGVGIASGEEFVGNVGGGGFKDFTALGDVTNIAARLTSRAEAGEILIGLSDLCSGR